MIDTRLDKINKKLNGLSLPFLCYDISMKTIFTDEVNILAKMVSDITWIDYKLLDDNVILVLMKYLLVGRMRKLRGGILFWK